MSDVSPTHPLVLLYGFGTASALITGYTFYSRHLRRINVATDIPSYMFRKRYLFGKVTSVGDGDNFHMFHLPGGRLGGWGWLRKIPEINTFRTLKNRTIHVRLCGVDAPERSHFGKPAQPYSEEALQWLRSYILGRKLYVKPLSLDQYNRVVAKVLVLKWNGFRDVSEEMIKNGIGTVYEAKQGVEFDGKEALYLAWEKYAKREKRGLWKDKNKKSFVSPREYKRINPQTHAAQHEKHPAVHGGEHVFQQQHQTVLAETEAKQVGQHHHPDVDDGPHAAQVSEPPLVLVRLGQLRGQHFRQQKQHNQPPPDQQPQLDVVPDGHKREHRKRRHDPALRAAQRHVHIPHDPLVVRAVPCPPELHRGVVVVDAADHVLWRVDAVTKSPESEHPPRNQKLEPYNIQVEQPDHRDLERSVAVPGLCFRHSNHIYVMQNELHEHDTAHQQQAVRGSPFPADRAQRVARLVDVVVEGENGACDEQRSVENIGKVVQQRVVHVLKSVIMSLSLIQFAGVLAFLVFFRLSPEIVQIETEESEQCEVEKHVPSGNQALERVHERQCGRKLAKLDGSVSVVEEQRGQAVGPQKSHAELFAGNAAKRVHDHGMEQNPETVEAVGAEQEQKPKNSVKYHLFGAQTQKDPLQHQMEHHQRRDHWHVVSEKPVLAVAVVDFSAKQPSVAQNALVAVVIGVCLVASLHGGLDHQWDNHHERDGVEPELQAFPPRGTCSFDDFGPLFRIGRRTKPRIQSFQRKKLVDVRDHK
ncbi:hypothetical protein KL910_000676 [Ogataea haglerorum]|nr:hypothetical protein KL945_003680 [Ogataea haglerorum]KAG7793981.1 hypothetical protein KL910_000676 [Ogataea haglerorum]